MHLKFRLSLAAVILLCLSISIFFPLSDDQLIYLRGGDLVLHGGKIYADYYDIKPPLIYYIFGVASLIFGSAEISIRFFDFLWQAATIFSLVWVVRRLTNDDFSAYWSGMFYAVSYVSLNVYHTLSCEGFAAIAVVWLIYAQGIEKKSMKIYLLEGLCLGWILSLKYPMGLLLVAVIAYDCITMQYSLKSLLKKWMFNGFSMVITMAILMFPFFDPTVRKGLLHISPYFAFYANYPAFNTALITKTLKSVAGFLGDNYSLGFLGCIAGGFILLFEKNISDNYSKKQIITFSYISALFLLLSVIVERKFFPYHFSRMYIPLSILAGTGAVYLYNNWWVKIRTFRFYQRITAYLLFLSAFLMSPIPRCLNLITYPIAALQHNYTKIDALQQQADPIISPRQDQRAIAEFIRSRSRQGSVFAMSTRASSLYYMLDEHPISRFINPTMYFGIAATNEMKQEMLHELATVQWLVVQTNDRHDILYGHDRTSWEMLQYDTESYNFVKKNFSEAKSIGNFKIFERIAW